MADTAENLVPTILRDIRNDHRPLLLSVVESLRRLEALADRLAALDAT